MADMDRMERALRNAHRAGDEQAARRIASAIREARQQDPSQPEQPQGRQVSPLEASNVGVASGLTFNFADELMAGAMTPIEMGIGAVTGEDEGKGLLGRVGDAYGRALERNRQYEAEAREQQPVASTVGDIAGGVATGGQLARGGATLLNAPRATYGQLMGRGAAEGAAYGAAYGAGAGEGVEGRARGAAMGAGVGAATGGAMGALGARGARAQANRSAPTTDRLRRMADSAYARADKAGLVVSQPSFNRLVGDIASTVRSEGLDRTIHPKATAALGRLVEAQGTTPTLRELDTLRRVVSSAAKSVEPDERRIASMMIERVDDYLANLSPRDVVAGDAQAASSAIKQARELWSRMRKGQVIEDLVERAQNSAANFSGSGYENALRTQFRQLANNKKRLRQFNKQEQAAILRVARGGPLENALRMIGKFAPTGIVSTTLSGGAGYALGGPVGSAALMGAGAVARMGAEAATRGNVSNAGAMVRAGGQIMPQLTAAQRAMLGGLVREGGQQGVNFVPVAGTP